jgi:UDP-N-acetylmuramyl-tripeptide synthetase
MKKLNSILKKCNSKYSINNFSNIEIKGVSTFSKKIQNNFIFGAIKGENFNGENFLKDLINLKKIVIVISDKSSIELKRFSSFIIIKTSDVKELVSEISHAFYNYKLDEIVAVTGTNGKTSVADYTRQLWQSIKIDAASIGTLGVIFKDNQIFNLNLTTPESIDLQKILNYLSKKNCKKAILEASSIGIDQKRLFKMKFNKVVFTNLTNDHLDYHKNFKKYKESKGDLFQDYVYKNTVAVINADDKYSEYFKNICKSQKIKFLDFGKKADFLKILKIKKEINSFFLEIKINNKKLKIFVNSLTKYDIYNKLCALLIVFENNIKSNHLDLLNFLKSPPGRLEKINSQNLNIFIDYAHTPDALRNVLLNLKKNCLGKIVTVIGCGGDRDKIKRPMMTREALKFSDKVIVTDDNPRNEDPKKIRNQMIHGLSENEKKNIKIIADRKKAIIFSLKIINKKDFLIIAGKGHENFQIVGEKKIYFSDKETVLNYLEKN